MMDKADFLFKGLSALMIPLLAWVLTLTSNLARIEQTLIESDRRLKTIEEQNKTIENELNQTGRILAETSAQLRIFLNRAQK